MKRTSDFFRKCTKCTSDCFLVCSNIDVSPLLKLGEDGDFDGEDGESDCQVGSGSGSGTPDLGVNSARSGDFGRPDFDGEEGISMLNIHR